MLQQHGLSTHHEVPFSALKCSDARLLPFLPRMRDTPEMGCTPPVLDI